MAFYSDNASNALRKPVAKPAPNAVPSYIHSPGLNPTSAQAYTNAAANYKPPVTPGGTPPTQDATAPPPTNPSAPPTGSSLPYAGVYLEKQNDAQKAYENAQTQLLSSRNALYHRYGLTDSGTVDPYSRYGDYQTMLGREGSDLDAAREASVGRGIGTGGLANQAQSALRFTDGSEQLDFQNQVLGADSDYRTGLAQALAAKNDSFRNAEEQANQDALSKLMADGYWTQASGTTPPPSGNDNPPPDNTNTPPTAAHAADALARYLANNAPVKKAPAKKATKARAN